MASPIEQAPPIEQASPIEQSGLKFPQWPKLEVMSRPDVGRAGRQIPLLTNHFCVRFSSPDSVFYQYNVRFW